MNDDINTIYSNNKKNPKRGVHYPDRSQEPTKLLTKHLNWQWISPSIHFDIHSFSLHFEPRKYHWSVCPGMQFETGIENAYHNKLISDIFQATDRGHDPRNGIQNNPKGLVILSAYGSSYSMVEDNETKNKKHTNIEYWMRNNGSSFDFNFTLKSCSQEMKQPIITCCGKWMANSQNASVFPYYSVMTLCVWRTYPSCFVCWL